MAIKSLGELDSLLEPYITKALEETRNDIESVVWEKITGYYYEPVFYGGSSYEPAKYDRTYKLMDSYSASDIIRVGNAYQFTCGWEDSYLQFTYKGGATGFEVLEWFNDKSHGGNVKGEHRFWDEALNELGGEAGIVNKFIGHLKSAGVPIK